MKKQTIKTCPKCNKPKIAKEPGSYCECEFIKGIPFGHIFYPMYGINWKKPIQGL